MLTIQLKAFHDELAKIAQQTQPVAAQPAKKKSLLRRVGPAAGSLVGGAVGLARGLRRPGSLLSSTLKGVGTGATIGWMPDVFGTAGEAVRDRMRGQ